MKIQAQKLAILTNYDILRNLSAGGQIEITNLLKKNAAKITFFL